MNILILRIIKIAVFFISFLIASRIAVSLLRKRNAHASMSDPEIIAVSAIFAAVITTSVSLILKAFI
ncbi:MAG TPA: hypothetical protein P5120_16735 [Spirochaetota bacterium]|nr:hypothetical protein [Spirochaetota bacterium]HPF07755.1 hypothetical protein [Spirochaetota bacterium]HPJ42702.1 hypothetical protein [Spirochaetota bacterium]HPR36925.1 hypothetical protein [Spirochaetota bacterium]HRX49168.1 hypothetical protein [Spirochaetota bacterium]